MYIADPTAEIDPVKLPKLTQSIDTLFRLYTVDNVHILIYMYVLNYSEKF